MNGAIFYSGKYGSTAQYADWISEETGLPVYDVKHSKADPAHYDYIILGSSVIVYKLTIRQWVEKNMAKLRNKPVLLFSVSGAREGAKLDGWVANSLPAELLSSTKHVALGGRMKPEKLGWLVRFFMRMGASRSKDPQVKKDELEGFDYMDRDGIKPVLEWIAQLDQPGKDQQGKKPEKVAAKPRVVSTA